MSGRVAAEHGVVCRLPGERLGYFGWPTVARLEDGTLVVASSGLRTEHICPWGKTVVNYSEDDGRTWSAPEVIQDSPIDDRDAGVIGLGGDRLLVSWFRSDTRQYAKASWLPEAERAKWTEALSTWTDQLVDELLGSWLLRSDDRGRTWSAPIPVPVSTPHGPIRLRSGELMYFGKVFAGEDPKISGQVAACRSRDDGLTWEQLGTVPLAPQTYSVNYHEPHVVELPSGRLLGTIRIQDHSGKSVEPAGIINFSIMQTESDDGGVTWTEARPMGFPGSPPHLMRHSSGVLVLTYGYRLAPFGQRVALSYDDGATWEHDWIIRDDGPDSDLGYPSTVEMADGSLFTVAYQKYAAGEKCSLLWSRWTLPA